jgi:hypothetical protein
VRYDDVVPRASHALLALCAVVATGCGDGGKVAPGPVDASVADASDGALPLAPRSPSKRALDDLVGLSSHPQQGASAAAHAEREFEFARLTEMGLHRMRTDFTWADIEPARGQWDFSQPDPLVADAVAAGVDLLAVLDYGVTWATSAKGANDDYPPDDPEDFALFGVAVANRYAGKVNDFEVWNEPNNGSRFWQPTLDGDPAAYGALLLRSTNAMIAAQPGANVAYAGVVYNYLVPGPVFVEQSLAANPALAMSLSTFGMHAYETYPPTRGPESDVGEEVPLVTKVATMSGVLAAQGDQDVPIWITEIGWPVTTSDPPAQQARYTVRACVLGALAGADRVYLYTLLDGPDPAAFPPEDAFGLMTYSDFGADAGAPMPKPAFVAVEALMTALGDYAVEERLPATPSDVVLVQLVDPGGRHAWIAWRATDGAPPVEVTFPASGQVQITLVDATTTDAVAGSGGFVVSVGPDPVIVAPP